jgi:hypothetical protein
MVVYKVSQSELDEAIRERIVSVVRFYTIRDGGVDVEKVNPATLLSRFGISMEDARRLVPKLVADGRIEKVA